MLLVTFNVNGIRARLHQLDFLVEKYNPDIICLQEIKVSDEELAAVNVVKEDFHGEWNYSIHPKR